MLECAVFLGSLWIYSKDYAFRTEEIYSYKEHYFDTTLIVTREEEHIQVQMKTSDFTKFLQECDFKLRDAK